MTTTKHVLSTGSFSQDWTNTGLITANDDWSLVASIVGYRTADVTALTGVDAQTITTDTGFVQQVLANAASTSTTGGVIEAETGASLGGNPTIAMQGSNGNDYAAIVIYLDSTGRENVRFQANIRDIDVSADNAAQQVVVQYRVGSSGVWTNVVYYADVTTASTADQVTVVNVVLPAAANNQSEVQIRILTVNSAGNDELVGIDDIVVSSTALPVAPAVSVGDAIIVEGDGGVSYLVFNVTLSSPAAGVVTADFATSPGSALDGQDFLGVTGQVTFEAGETVQQISIPIIGDIAAETLETLTVTLSSVTGADPGDLVATGTITDNDPAYFSLAGGNFSQDWNTTGQIAASDDWSGVPFIIGYRGDDLTISTGTDARTITTTSSVVDVNANQTNPDTFTTGGVAEFHNTPPADDPTIALNGSGTADAPYIVLFMDATGRSAIRLQATLRDLDGSADDAAMQINVQYRTDPNGAWINVPGGYFADVTTVNLATDETPLDVTLPPGADGAGRLQIRIMTTNAVGNDEWVGIDDIVVSSVLGGPTLSIADAVVLEGDAGNTPISFTVTRNGSTAGEVSATYTVTLGSGVFDAAVDDFEVGQVFTGTVTFADGDTEETIILNIDGDVGPEGDDAFTVTLSSPVGATIVDGTALGTIVNDDGPPSLVTIDNVTMVEGDAGTSLMTFTVTRTGGTDAFDVEYDTSDITATAGDDYVGASGTLNFLADQMSQQISITINGDVTPELSETFQILLSNATNGALITDAVGIGTIGPDDPLFIHDIQGNSYFSPLLAAEGTTGFNIATTAFVTVRAIVTAVDNDGDRQGFYLQEEVTDWDGNSFTSEGIFVMTRDDDLVGVPVSGVAIGDLVTVTAGVMEYQGFSTNMPITALVNASSILVNSTGNTLPTLLLDAGHPIPNSILTNVTPDYTDSADGVGDTFDASLFALSYFETVEGMLVTIPDMVVADGFVDTFGGQPFFKAYSTVHADTDQINDRGGYTIAGDPPNSPPDSADADDGTTQGGRHLHDGDVNPDIIELDFTGFAIDAYPGLTENATMGDALGDVTGIVDFDFSELKLFVTDIDAGSFVNDQPVRETTALGADNRSLTVATFNVENLAGDDAQSRFDDIADAIANNLNMPDIITIEEIQDNDGNDDTGVTDASVTWGRLVAAVNLATGGNYQWVDQDPGYDVEGGEDFGNIRVGFLYNTDRVQLGDLDAAATLTERRQYTDRIGDGLRDGSDLIAFSDNMLGAELSPSDWSGTRRSLLGEFTFNGNTVFVTANHFPAKGGSGSFWQFDQDPANGDPDNSGWAQRNAVGEDVYAMMNLIEGSATGAGIIAGGDFNDFYFYRPLEVVTGYVLADGTARVGGARFDNLTLTLTEAERYTYDFDGRSQAIDHIIVNSMLGGVATYDVVHINTGYNGAGTGPDADPSLSDHEPAMSSFDFREFSELLTGTAGADTISGFGGNDVIGTLGGADIIDGGIGADAMFGGLGDDVYFVDDFGDGVGEAAAEGRDIVYASATWALAAGSHVEVVSTASLTGTAAINLFGNELAQEIYGNAGANDLRGGGGADDLVGFGGDDEYWVGDPLERVVEASGEGRDVVYASVSYALAAGSHVEVLSSASLIDTAPLALTGNALGQEILGNAGANVLRGGGGADVLVGFGGNDEYWVIDANERAVEGASGGSDVVYASVHYTLAEGAHVEVLSTASLIAVTAINLTGNELGQELLGNSGANVLDGGGGADVLVGGNGADSFAFTTALGGGNVDTIADYLGVGAGFDDAILLDDAVFTGLTPGALNPNAFVAGTAAQDADDRIIYDANSGSLYFDADGNGAGAQILFAILSNAPAVTASDFTVI